MPTLMIPAERSWQGAEQPRRLRANHPRQTRTVAQTVRVAWVWGQRVLLALALILFLTIGVLPRLGLYRPVTVLSGSMRPTFSPGDMVVVVPEPVSAVRVGQVISYQVPVGIHQVETHRVVRILQGGPHPTVQTQGDANNYHDPWTAKLEGDTAWRMVAVIPHLGYVVNFLRSPTLQKAAIFLAPALLALLILSEIWGVGDGEADSEDGPRRRGASAPMPGARRASELPFVIGAPPGTSVS
jgi:signal peptidase